jgi:exonuclease SbcC
MRILKLRIQNLNSLEGEWEIDFNHPVYRYGGLFAITGPTGVGKSTLLDGICLALYGQTPRLGHVTKSENEIMAKHQGECLAEVEFETGKGRYRCFWGQHRARRKPGGDLQNPRHEIHLILPEERLLETRKQGVAAKVEEVTGLRFEQFTRSILLAQGAFAAFLAAKGDERASILEQITGTEIYARISQKVFEIARENREVMARIQQEINAVALLTPEDWEAAKIREGALQDEIRRLDAALAGVQRQIRRRQDIIGLERDLAEIESGQSQVKAETAAEAPNFIKLAEAQKALSIRPEYQLLTAGERRLQEIQALLEKDRSSLETAEAELRLAVAEKEEAQGALTDAEAHLNGSLPGIRQARELDQQMKPLRDEIKDLSQKIKEREAQEARLLEERQDTQREWEEKSRLKGKWERYLTDFDRDADLNEKMEGFRQRLRQWNQRLEQIREKEEAMAVLQAKGSEIESALPGMEKSLRELETRVQAQQSEVLEKKLKLEQVCQGSDIGRWRQKYQESAAEIEAVGQALLKLEEWIKLVKTRRQTAEKLFKLEADRGTLTTQKEMLEETSRVKSELLNRLEQDLAVWKKMESFEAERERLREGEPCPLCGALEHPFAKAGPEARDEGEVRKARASLKETEMALAQMAGRLSGLEAGIEEASGQLNGLAREMEQEKGILGRRLSALDIWDEMAESTGNRRNGTETGVESWIESVIESWIQSAIETGAGSGDEAGAGAGTGGEQAFYQRLSNVKEEKEAQLKDTQTIIGDAEKISQEISSMESASNEWQLRRTREEAAWESEKSRLGLNRERETGVERECARLVQARDAERAEWLGELACYGDFAPGASFEAILKSLEKRRKAYEEASQGKTAAEQAMQKILQAQEKVQGALQSLEESLGWDKERYQKVLERGTELKTRRVQLLGEQDPDSAEQALRGGVNSAQDTLNGKEDGHREAAAALEGIRQSLLRRAQESQDQEAALKEAGLQWEVSLSRVGFESQEVFLKAWMTEEEMEALTQRRKGLEDRAAELEALDKNKRRQLEALAEEARTEPPLEDLEESEAEQKAQISQARETLGGVKQILREQDLKQIQWGQLNERLAEARSARAGWEDLNALIGSSDGKKFRNLAQNMTFDVVIAYANSQLKGMSDRYVLQRDVRVNLELAVSDLYQGGQLRSIKNLSGGESFLVSLALALGLSSMASQNVRLESLFLDEGFGNLDEETLETALRALTKINQTGRLIGVISHVAALKDQIGTQIQVIPERNGRSRLEGPGVSRRPYHQNR